MCVAEIATVAISYLAAQSIANSMPKLESPSIQTMGASPHMQDPTQTESAVARQNRLDKLRQGMAKTIKTSPAGLSSAPQLSTPLAYATGIKAKLGQ